MQNHNGGDNVSQSYLETMQRLQDAFCDSLPAGLSLCNELIDQRCEEARRESCC